MKKKFIRQLCFPTRKISRRYESKKELIKIQEDNLNQIAASSNSYSQIKTARQTLNNAISQVNSLIKEYNENVAQSQKNLRTISNRRQHLQLANKFL